MTKALRNLGASAALIALAGASHGFHLATAKEVSKVVEESLSEVPTFYLPDGASVRPFLLGQQTTAADLYFLKLVQYIGTPMAEKAGWPQLLQLGQLITDLDPEYGYAYQVIGILLSVKKRIDESNEIFEKGMTHVPKRWELPFYSSYNYWFERGDLTRGAELLFRAAGVTGGPPWLSDLASRLYSSAGQIETALQFIAGVLATDPPAAIRDDLLQRRQELLIERELQALENGIQQFHLRTGRRPSSLRELSGTVMAFIPAAPDGTSFSYDPKTGEVSSPLLPKRLVLHRAENVPSIELEERQ